MTDPAGRPQNHEIQGPPQPFRRDPAHPDDRRPGDRRHRRLHRPTEVPGTSRYKKLGLTLSFETGYEISPRGRAFLDALPH